MGEVGSDIREVREMDETVGILALELPEKVHTHVTKRWRAVRDMIYRAGALQQSMLDTTHKHQRDALRAENEQVKKALQGVRTNLNINPEHIPPPFPEATEADWMQAVLSHLRAENERLRKALEHSRGAIRTLDPAELGRHPEEGYFFRDELLAEIDAALSAQPEKGE